MLTPKYPKPDTTRPIAMAPAESASEPLSTTRHAAPAYGDHQAQAAQYIPVPAAPTRPTVQLTPGALITIAAGGTVAVLVIGTVLVSMLLAVALTAVSVAVCAVVLRSLLNGQNKHH